MEIPKKGFCEPAYWPFTSIRDQFFEVCQFTFFVDRCQSHLRTFVTKFTIVQKLKVGVLNQFWQCQGFESGCPLPINCFICLCSKIVRKNCFMWHAISGRGALIQCCPNLTSYSSSPTSPLLVLLVIPPMLLIKLAAMGELCGKLGQTRPTHALAKLH